MFSGYGLTNTYLSRISGPSILGLAEGRLTLFITIPETQPHEGDLKETRFTDRQ